MFLKAAKDRPPHFTPALEKLFNRVLARVYRGSTRKKCSKERLLSLQHTELAKKGNHPITIMTSRPSHHTLARKRQFGAGRFTYTEPRLPESVEMRKFTSYHSQRSTDGSFLKPDRCKTDANKSRDRDLFAKSPEDSSDPMIHSQLFSGAGNKIHQPALKNRLSLKPYAEEADETHKVRGNHCELIKQGTTRSRLKQFEHRRKINTIIKTKNQLEADLLKNNHKHLFEPWEVEQNDDLFF